MIGITEEHSIVRSHSLVKTISFDKIGIQDTRTMVKGKKKSNLYSFIKGGGVRINPNMTIAVVTMEDGTQHELKAVVEGFIIEINSNLFSDPTYLQNYSQSKGFLAFVNPHGNDKKQKETLLD
jgi:glycine cleavage system H lipoate-binding protein